MANADNAGELPIKIVKCFGIIPVRFQDGRFELFIIQQRAGHWGFPKGHPEPQDKSEYESACREMKEECNLEVKQVLFEDTFTDTYQYVKRGVLKDKTVLLWAAEVRDPEAVKLQADEVLDGRWVKSDEVCLSLTREHSKVLLKKVLEKIEAV